MSHRLAFQLDLRECQARLGERTLVMGIVNATPDSFSDGGRYLDPEHAIAHGLELVKQGADWIDVGGESTRPGAEPVSVEEEMRRVIPVVRGLHRKRPSLVISVDTTKADVAEAAARAGASILNDVSGLSFDPRIADVARRYKTGLVLMHSRHTPQTMQQKPFARSIWRSVRDGLKRSINRALAAGVKRSKLILDPGLGFGKSREQNFEILAHLSRLQGFRLPVLVGTSRKSFVRDTGARHGVALQIADSAAVVASILGGAHIVRVHDVAAMLPAIRIADEIVR
jgi:dihydropteroate synthase